MPKERPILFNGDMVRALLDGRKTQTRRIVKPTKDRNGSGCHLSPCEVAGEINAGDYFLCPYGQPGDRLWVKETWRPEIAHSCAMDACDCADVFVRYAAGGTGQPFFDRDIPDEWLMPKASAKGNVSPLFMPRWASRITLEIVSVRVEWLQDISPNYCIEEGAWRIEDKEIGRGHEAVDAYRALWQSINGADSWGANPWVWVVEFKRVEDSL